ncbi:MAG TPA: serine hydrolase [Vicinamibacterales bacterium]|nr:serine hydrolase [Vicinamibacterales bacterium]|tara:strand:+ start:1105 stop:1971 length:867 start_codon:yes stop_codon:yes gene_type:complete
MAIIFGVLSTDAASVRNGVRVEEAEQAGAVEPRTKQNENGETVPDVRAAAAVIYNPIRGEVLWEENSEVQRPIASITKVMTAVVFLEAEHNLSQMIRVARTDVQRASTTYLRRNEQLTVNDLLHLVLIASDNGAARALARVSAWGTDGFVGRMNQKATALGLHSTVFTDPSGLDSGNLSSAYDLSRLIVYAAGNEQISGIMRMGEHRIRTNRRQVRVRNTNKLLRHEINVLGGKTGFIRKSGYCLAVLLELPQGEMVAMVLLGARSDAARFLEARRLLGWLDTRRPAE